MPAKDGQEAYKSYNVKTEVSESHCNFCNFVTLTALADLIGVNAS
jgi:hypothetical protein